MRRFSPVVALLAVTAVWEDRLSEGLKELGLSTRRYGLLAHIAAGPGLSFSEIARRSQITVQTAHSAVRTLVEDGLVDDMTSHAGAASDLRVTRKGTRVLAAADRVLEALDVSFAQGSPTLTASLQGMHEEPFAG